MTQYQNGTGSPLYMAHLASTGTQDPVNDEVGHDYDSSHDTHLMPPLPREAYINPSVAADASPWLDAYIEHSRRWSPRSYSGVHEAIGLWILSTVAARRVRVHIGDQRFTNLMIALVARTSIWAKTTGAKVGIGVLNDCGLSHLLASDDATPQAFIKSLAARVPDDWGDLSRERQLAWEERAAFAGQKGWFYDEFGQKVSAMMRDGGNMADYRGIFRRFDDTPTTYVYETVGRGRDEVHAPYLALLANLTPADLQPFAKRGAALWGDGFWARFIFVTPTPGTPRKKDRFPEGERTTPTFLRTKLKNWHNRLGIHCPEIRIELGDEGDIDHEGSGGKGRGKRSATGKMRYELEVPEPSPCTCTLGDGVYDAYYRYHDALGDIIEMSPNHDLDGNYSRMAEKALRVAILLGSLENDNRIEMRHWARAQQIAESWRQGLHNLYDEITGGSLAEGESLQDKVMGRIAKKGPQTQRELCQAISGFDASLATDLLSKMVEDGDLIATEAGRTVRYSLAG